MLSGVEVFVPTKAGAGDTGRCREPRDDSCRNTVGDRTALVSGPTFTSNESEGHRGDFRIHPPTGASRLAPNPAITAMTLRKFVRAIATDDRLAG